MLRGPLPPLAIPATLHDSLMARLDRLKWVKEVAQSAACIGREFSHELLAAVSSLQDDRLEEALGKLVDSELILSRGMAPAQTYMFRHALVQEAAHASLLRGRRQQLHGKIASTVEERFPEIAQLQPELLAHHWTEAGLPEPAADNWLRAARRAKEAFANREAKSHLQKCLEVISSASSGALDPPADLDRRRLDALVLLGDLASLAGDLEEANQHYEQALEAVSEPRVRTWIGNKRHRPGVGVRDGARIAFYEHGGGQQTLLFVGPQSYGLGAFQPILERLCQEFRIVTVDARGSGASDPLTRPYPLIEHVRDVRAVVAALGDGPVVGVGISRGSNVLLRLAHREPQLFDKLVTIGAPPSTPAPPYFSDEYLRRCGQAFEAEDLEQLLRVHIAFACSEPEMLELRELIVRGRLQIARETLLSFWDPDPTAEVMPILADTTVPTLVTHGREDRLVSFEAAEHIAARLPNAELYAFDGKGHFPIFTATEEFCEVLRGFVHKRN
ncbi:MAG: alpha/beta fold hydrolase [Geminicoccaceae bacterium]